MHDSWVTANRERLFAGFSAFCACFLLSLPVSAAATGEIEETIVVSAHRIPIAREAAGSTVSTSDRAFIEQRQTVFATDLLQTMPGTAVSRTAAAGSQTQVRIRGAEANQVLVIIDGVEANDPAGNDEFDFSALTSYDVEHIELVRGPQSALWGSDAAAGILQITTRTADAPLSGDGFIEGGSLGTAYGGGRIAASSARGAVSLGASYYDSRGESAAAAGTEDDGYENLTLTLKSRLAPADGTELAFTARYRDATSEFDGTDFSTGLPADADLASEDDLLLLSARAGQTLFDERWDQSLKFTYLDSNRRQFADGAQESRSSADKFGVYYQSTFALGAAADAERHRLVLALDHEREEFTQRGIASFFGDPNQDRSMDNTGWVAEFLSRPLERLDVSASVRHDDNSDFENTTTYRLTASYLLANDTTRLHTSWGTGRKSPTFIDRFGYFSGQFLGNPDLKPEQTRGFDVGIAQALLTGLLNVDLTYFDERLEDEIDGFVFDSASGLFTAANLDGESRRQGAELQLDARLGEALRARLSYTYLDTRQPDPTGGSSREIRRPRHSAALNLNQALLRGRGNLNLNLTYTGDQTDQYFPPPSFNARTLTLDDYLLLDLTASYALSERLTLYARANNLLNESYTNVIGYQAPGRGVYAGVRFGAAR